MAKTSARESLTSLSIRVGDPRKQPASCPVCSCPFGLSEDKLRVVRCARCGVKHHDPCFWRVLPLREWVEYVRRGIETTAQNDDDDDDLEDEDGFKMICAVCRKKAGL